MFVDQAKLLVLQIESGLDHIDHPRMDECDEEEFTFQIQQDGAWIDISESKLSSMVE